MKNFGIHMENNKLFVISRYNESFDWISEYTNNYLVYNKGNIIIDPRVKNLENFGGNQRDICYFAYSNYENLPDLTVFIQANPFDHCKKEVFDKLIHNEAFTSLEFYGTIPANSFENRDQNGGFMEINNSWYILAHNTTHNQSCKYFSFDHFMNTYFENYDAPVWIRFAPGSQYIVEKKQILQYPKSFWLSLMDELNSKTPTEAHIVERAMYYILTGKYKLNNLYRKEQSEQ